MLSDKRRPNRRGLSASLSEGSPLRSAARRGRLLRRASIAPILSDTDVEIAKEFERGKNELHSDELQ